MSIPICQVCGKSGTGIQFPVFIRKHTQFAFGEICTTCDEEPTNDKET